MSRIIKKIIKNNLTKIIIVIIINIILWFISIILPTITGKYIDLLLKENSMAVIYKFMNVFIIFIIIQILFSYLSNILSTKLNNNISFEITNYLINHIKEISLLNLNKYNPSYLSQRINTDSLIVTSFFLNNMINLLLNFFTLIFIACYIFKSNIYLGIIFFSLIPLYIFEYVLFKRSLYEKNYTLKESKNHFFAVLNEQISTIKLMKLNSWFKEYEFDLKESFGNFFRHSIAYAKTMYKFNNIGSFISSIGSIILFFYGGTLVVKGVLSVGVFIAINSYYKALYSSIGYFLNFLPSYQETLVSYKRLNEIYNIPIEESGKGKLDNIEEIKIKNLSFCYENEKKIFDKFNYDFIKGNIYCINGENGRGKSTLINLLMGLYTNYDGDIFFNMSNLKTLNLYKIRKNLIGIMEQEPKLMDFSILKNITYGFNYNVDYPVVEKWCKSFSVINDEKLYNSFLNNKDNYKLVSGGQKQKIAIIRTLLKDPNVVILDEPTSCLDERAIDILKNILKDIKKDKIIILITHNKMLWDIADYIINL